MSSGLQLRQRASPTIGRAVFLWIQPQNPTQIPTLEDALNAARAALESDACKNLFKKGNGLEKLNQLAKDNKIKIEDTKVPKELSSTGRLKDAPGIGEAAKDGKVFINPSSPIMKGTYKYDSPVVAFSGMKPEQALATLIIHGVLHVTKDIAPDGKDPNASRLHNIDVRDACFPKPDP